MYDYLKNDNFPERIRSYYEIQHGKNENINELRTNSLLANSFIPVEMKYVKQVKKGKRKLKSFISQCSACQIKKKSYYINVLERLIIDKGPYDEYQMDLFYLDEDIVEKTSYKYITNLIEHLSKWICSYTLKTKTGRDFCYV